LAILAGLQMHQQLPHKSDKSWKFVSASSVVSPQITLVFGGGAL
jgi:hypothetical protein